MIPYLVAVIGDVLGIFKRPMPGVVLTVLIVLAAAGVILAAVTVKLEKRHAS